MTGAYLSDGQGQGTITNDDIPATVTATAGTPQSTTGNTAFATNLQATVKDASNNPLSGVTVTFTAPGSGASGTFAGGVNTAVTNASGIATAAVFTANRTAGSYNVSASVSGVGTPATFSLTNNPASTNVTVTTSPAGLSFTVDATTYSSSQTFNWAPGGNHTIATTSPQNPGAGTQYVFLNWSDAGAISHSITAPSTATTYTANFKTQHQLTTSASAGGSISPASGFYDEGNVVITATTDPGFTFTGFSGALSGTTNPQTLNLTGPATVTANFEVVVTGVCPQPNGYWKSNPAEWPASALPMMLGTLSYTQQQLLTILNTHVGSGTKADASLILAYQLIAAKLNIAAAAEAPAPVPATIVAADNAIGENAIPMKIRTNTSLGRTMTSLASTLEGYNNGILNSGCSSAPKSAEGSGGTMLDGIPESIALQQNYPNPFNPSTTISFALPEASEVTLAIYNTSGQVVKTLVVAEMSAGHHSFVWDAKDESGAHVASGVYLYVIKAGEFTAQKKLVLMK